MSCDEGLRLDELVRELPAGSRLTGDGAVRVRGVHQDSRRIAPDDLFVALKGARADGGTFIDDARSRGAVAVLVDEQSAVPAALPYIRVLDTRTSLALAAAAVYGHPAFGLDIIGITGTNGKTTTAHLVKAAVDGALGRPSCGLIGTVGHSYGALDVVAEHTTPEADDLARILASMRDLGATHVAMEVSSIALTSRRVHAIRFRVGAFTNLTQDHLDYHGSMEAYGEAKAELFTVSAPGTAVIHVGDPFGRRLAHRVNAPLVRVSCEVGAAATDAEIAPTSLRLSARGIEARVRVPGGAVDLVSPLFGLHNVENLLVALGVVVALGLDLPRAVEALRNERGAPGRLERCEFAEDDVVVLVDYAHTPDALARVLASVRALSKGRVLVVFGCGGDRDRTKRGPMGEAAASGADLAIVTNDNPRGESPEDIARPIIEGLVHHGLSDVGPSGLRSASRGYAIELDRARAIDAAVSSALAGDTVVICGKGHEDYQVVGDERLPFDDRIEARRALARRRPRSTRGSSG
jgi:UDP-N-acetylmuramoyl-L-alanyl-D-glutamate--2,6-diaminopimelate ligase